jgi:hypothetical protein
MVNGPGGVKTQNRAGKVQRVRNSLSRQSSPKDDRRAFIHLLTCCNGGSRHLTVAGAKHIPRSAQLRIPRTCATIGHRQRDRAGPGRIARGMSASFRLLGRAPTLRTCRVDAFATMSEGMRKSLREGCNLHPREICPVCGSLVRQSLGCVCSICETDPLTQQRAKIAKKPARTSLGAAVRVVLGSMTTRSVCQRDNPLTTLGGAFALEIGIDALTHQPSRAKRGQRRLRERP